METQLIEVVGLEPVLNYIKGRDLEVHAKVIRLLKPVLLKRRELLGGNQGVGFGLTNAPSARLIDPGHPAESSTDLFMFYVLEMMEDKAGQTVHAFIIAFDQRQVYEADVAQIH